MTNNCTQNLVIIIVKSSRSKFNHVLENKYDRESQKKSFYISGLQADSLLNEHHETSLTGAESKTLTKIPVRLWEWWSRGLRGPGFESRPDQQIFLGTKLITHVPHLTGCENGYL